MANNGTGSLRQGPAQDVCAAAAEGDCLHCIARLQIRVCEEGVVTGFAAMAESRFVAAPVVHVQSTCSADRDGLVRVCMTAVMINEII